MKIRKYFWISSSVGSTTSLVKFIRPSVDILLWVSSYISIDISMWCDYTIGHPFTDSANFYSCYPSIVSFHCDTMSIIIYINRYINVMWFYYWSSFHWFCKFRFLLSIHCLISLIFCWFVLFIFIISVNIHQIF